VNKQDEEEEEEDVEIVVNADSALGIFLFPQRCLRSVSLTNRDSAVAHEYTLL